MEKYIHVKYQMGTSPKVIMIVWKRLYPFDSKRSYTSLGGGGGGGGKILPNLNC
jgi:hypothetical protein